MNPANQHGYCILAFLRQGIALTLAVNIFALPMTLYYFHQFPFMSLLYNLFFPFLASGSLCLMLIGGLLSFFPFLANGIHRLNDLYTHMLIQFTHQIPSEMDVWLVLDDIHPTWIVGYFCCATLAGILLKEKFASEEKSDSFSFI